MGEKYDSCYDDEPLYYGGPRLQLTRIQSPVGDGFPPDQLAEMLGGGPAGLQQVAQYTLRVPNSIEQIARQVSETLPSADADPAAKLAAGQQALTQLHDGATQVRTQIAQSTATLQMIDRAGAYPTAQLAGVAREAAQKTTHAVSELGLLDQAIDAVLSTAQDQALASIGDQAAAAVSRIGQFAQSNVAALRNGLVRRGQGDVSGGTGSAT